MAKYYECPTANYECPYWDWKEYKCAMEIIDGDSPAGQCDEYDAFNDEEEEEEEDEGYLSLKFDQTKPCIWGGRE